MTKYFALLPAAGVGSRMGVDQPKQYIDLHGRPMLWHTIRVFDTHPRIERVFVVRSPEDAWWETCDWSHFAKLAPLTCGGATRAESVRNGLRAVVGEVAADAWVLVHDAARPCLTHALLENLLNELSEDAVGGLLAVPVADTLKRADAVGRILATMPRDGLWAAQTPQMFRHALLLDALERVGAAVTDEASAIEALGLSPKLVESDLTNMKVTFPRDLDMAVRLLKT